MPTLPRPRNPTILPIQEAHYRARGRARDGKCLITELETQTYSRLKVAHIFPRAHDQEVSCFFYDDCKFLSADSTAVDTQRLSKQDHRHCRRIHYGRPVEDRLSAERYHLAKRFARCMGQL